MTENTPSQPQNYDTNLGTKGISIITRSSHQCYATFADEHLFDGVITTCTLKEYLQAIYKTYPDVIGIHLQGFR